MTASSPTMSCWHKPLWPNSTSPCRPLPTSPSHNAPTPIPTSRSLTPCLAPGRSLPRVSSWPLAHNGPLCVCRGQASQDGGRERLRGTLGDGLGTGAWEGWMEGTLDRILRGDYLHSNIRDGFTYASS